LQLPDFTALRGDGGFVLGNLRSLMTHHRACLFELVAKRLGVRFFNRVRHLHD